jgi:coproporphyrinogen III oxidase-like Fe-S oxidoreductase
LCATIGDRLPGYRRYEISNYALPGYECRHNLHYWRNEEYAGFGPGAYSYIDGVRARNDTNLDRYLAAPGTKRESLALSIEEQRVETIIQYLRLDTRSAQNGLRRPFRRKARGTLRRTDCPTRFARPHHVRCGARFAADGTRL